MTDNPWDAPCDHCGHMGVAHTSRRCIDIGCPCTNYQSYACDAAWIGRLENVIREVGQYCLDQMASDPSAKEILQPVWGRVAVGVSPLSRRDVLLGRLYAVEQDAKREESE